MSSQDEIKPSELPASSTDNASKDSEEILARNGDELNINDKSSFLENKDDASSSHGYYFNQIHDLDKKVKDKDTPTYYAADGLRRFLSERYFPDINIKESYQLNQDEKIGDYETSNLEFNYSGKSPFRPSVRFSPVSTHNVIPGSYFDQSVKQNVMTNAKQLNNLSKLIDFSETSLEELRANHLDAGSISSEVPSWNNFAPPNCLLSKEKVPKTESSNIKTSNNSEKMNLFLYAQPEYANYQDGDKFFQQSHFEVPNFISESKCFNKGPGISQNASISTENILPQNKITNNDITSHPIRQNTSDIANENHSNFAICSEIPSNKTDTSKLEKTKILGNSLEIRNDQGNDIDTQLHSYTLDSIRHKYKKITDIVNRFFEFHDLSSVNEKQYKEVLMEVAAVIGVINCSSLDTNSSSKYKDILSNNYNLNPQYNAESSVSSIIEHKIVNTNTNSAAEISSSSAHNIMNSIEGDCRKDENSMVDLKVGVNNNRINNFDNNKESHQNMGLLLNELNCCSENVDRTKFVCSENKTEFKFSLPHCDILNTEAENFSSCSTEQEVCLKEQTVGGQENNNISSFANSFLAEKNNNYDFQGMFNVKRQNSDGATTSNPNTRFMNISGNNYRQNAEISENNEGNLDRTKFFCSENKTEFKFSLLHCDILNTEAENFPSCSSEQEVCLKEQTVGGQENNNIPSFANNFLTEKNNNYDFHGMFNVKRENGDGATTSNPNALTRFMNISGNNYRQNAEISENNEGNFIHGCIGEKNFRTEIVNGEENFGRNMSSVEGLIKEFDTAESYVSCKMKPATSFDKNTTEKTLDKDKRCVDSKIKNISNSDIVHTSGYEPLQRKTKSPNCEQAADEGTSFKMSSALLTTPDSNRNFRKQGWQFYHLKPAAKENNRSACGYEIFPRQNISPINSITQENRNEPDIVSTEKQTLKRISPKEQSANSESDCKKLKSREMQQKSILTSLSSVANDDTISILNTGINVVTEENCSEPTIVSSEKKTPKDQDTSPQTDPKKLKSCKMQSQSISASFASFGEVDILPSLDISTTNTVIAENQSELNTVNSEINTLKRSSPKDQSTNSQSDPKKLKSSKIHSKSIFASFTSVTEGASNEKNTLKRTSPKVHSTNSQDDSEKFESSIMRPKSIFTSFCSVEKENTDPSLNVSATNAVTEQNHSESIIVSGEKQYLKRTSPKDPSTNTESDPKKLKSFKMQPKPLFANDTVPSFNIETTNAVRAKNLDESTIISIEKKSPKRASPKDQSTNSQSDPKKFRSCEMRPKSIFPSFASIADADILSSLNIDTTNYVISENHCEPNTVKSGIHTLKRRSPKDQCTNSQSDPKKLKSSKMQPKSSFASSVNDATDASFDINATNAVAKQNHSESNVANNEKHTLKRASPKDQLTNTESDPKKLKSSKMQPKSSLAIFSSSVNDATDSSFDINATNAVTKQNHSESTVANNEKQVLKRASPRDESTNTESDPKKLKSCKMQPKPVSASFIPVAEGDIVPRPNTGTTVAVTTEKILSLQRISPSNRSTGSQSDFKQLKSDKMQPNSYVPFDSQVSIQNNGSPKNLQKSDVNSTQEENSLSSNSHIAAIVNKFNNKGQGRSTFNDNEFVFGPRRFTTKVIDGYPTIFLDNNYQFTSVAPPVFESPAAAAKQLVEKGSSKKTPQKNTKRLNGSDKIRSKRIISTPFPPRPKTARSKKISSGRKQEYDSDEE